MGGRGPINGHDHGRFYSKTRAKNSLIFFQKAI